MKIKSLCKNWKLWQILCLELWVNHQIYLCLIAIDFVQKTFSNTNMLQISTEGPYKQPLSNNSGAAYSGDPQCVFKSSPLLKRLLKPKSKRENLLRIHSVCDH